MLLSILNAHNLAQAETGISPWLWILILLVVIVILIWLFTRNLPEEFPEEEKAPEVVPDDLTRIEGIGPKTQEVFQQAGIQSFQQLADASVEELDHILDEAGLQLGDPTTWPRQARLAAEEKWEELKQLQDELIGGR